MITKRQYKIISFFLTRSLFLGLGISRILKLAKNDAWIACILGAILVLLIISFIYKLKKNFELGNNLDNSFATGASENSGFTSPFGLPRCELNIILQFCSIKYFIVGNAETILLLSVMF